MKYYFPILLLVILAVSGCVSLPPTGGPECYTDSDCVDSYGDGFICDANGDCSQCPIPECVAPPENCHYVPDDSARCPTCGELKCDEPVVDCRSVKDCDYGKKCVDGFCVDGNTQSNPSCDDNIQNGDEMGVDCGGYDCPACTTTQKYEDLYGTKTKYSCDYYASPSGGGNGLSENNPFKISDFWGINNLPGKTLCLLDGTYKGMNSMIQPPEGLSGVDGKPIRVVALHDGQAFIDGEGENGPVYLKSNDWFVFEGFNAFDANQDFRGNIYSSVFHIYSSKNIVVRRVIGWDAGLGNTAIFGSDYSSKITFEDIAGFGQARKIVTGGHRSDERFDSSLYNNRIRRAFGRLQRNDYGGPGIMTVGYNTNGGIIENSIATIDGYFQNIVGEGSSDNHGIFDDRQWDEHNQILGSIIYKTADQKIEGMETNSYIYADSKYMKVKDDLVFVEGTQDTFGTNLEATARLNHYHHDNFEGKYLTFIGGPGVAIGPSANSIISNIIVTNVQWNENTDTTGGRRVPATGLFSLITSWGPAEYVMAYNNKKNWNAEPTHYSIENPNLISKFGNLLQYGTAQRPMVDGQPVGAQIACRYENGVLTNKPLWPWLMNERIRVATCMYDDKKTKDYCESHKDLGIDVTKTVFELGGGHVPDFNKLNPIVCPGENNKNTNKLTGEVSIMPLGDSITLGITGSTQDVGYRRKLYLDLINAGYDVKFVGPRVTGLLEDFNRHNAGYSGIEAYNPTEGSIASKVMWLLDNNPTNVILLHIGTNDIGQGDSASQTNDDIIRVLDKIDNWENANNRFVTVVLAKIILRGSGGSQPAIDYNSLITQTVNSRIANGDHIVLVDMQNALNYPDDLADGTHPNDVGYDKMADVWFKALTKIIQK